MELATGVDPDSIEVDACEIASRAAINNTVWVKHWKQLKDEVVSKDLGIQGWSRDVVDNTLHHPGGPRLSRVNPAANHDAFPGFYRFRITLKSRADQHFAVISCNRLAEGLAAHSGLALRIGL
jgi:hypothetical protein